MSPCFPSPLSGGVLRNSSAVRWPPARLFAVSSSPDTAVSVTTGSFEVVRSRYVDVVIPSLD